MYKKNTHPIYILYIYIYIFSIHIYIFSIYTLDTFNTWDTLNKWDTLYTGLYDSHSNGVRSSGMLSGERWGAGVETHFQEIS